MITPLLRQVSLEQLSSARRCPVDPAALTVAAAILDDVEARGDQAVHDRAIHGHDTDGRGVLFAR